VPRITAPVATTTAMPKLSLAASISCSLWNSATYHWVEKPAQMVASALAVNEKTISRTIGR
jgi:hypothetical protein